MCYVERLKKRQCTSEVKGNGKTQGGDLQLPIQCKILIPKFRLPPKSILSRSVYSRILLAALVKESIRRDCKSESEDIIGGSVCLRIKVGYTNIIMQAGMKWKDTE